MSPEHITERNDFVEFREKGLKSFLATCGHDFEQSDWEHLLSCQTCRTAAEVLSDTLFPYFQPKDVFWEEVRAYLSGMHPSEGQIIEHLEALYELSRALDKLDSEGKIRFKEYDDYVGDFIITTHDPNVSRLIRDFKKERGRSGYHIYNICKNCFNKSQQLKPRSQE